jgi:hypothetical protein
MSSLARSLLTTVCALSLSAPAFAQPKVDARSGPTGPPTGTIDNLMRSSPAGRVGVARFQLLSLL